MLCSPVVCANYNFFFFFFLIVMICFYVFNSCLLVWRVTVFCPVKCVKLRESVALITHDERSGHAPAHTPEEFYFISLFL